MALYNIQSLSHFLANVNLLGSMRLKLVQSFVCLNLQINVKLMPTTPYHEWAFHKKDCYNYILLQSFGNFSFSQTENKKKRGGDNKGLFFMLSVDVHWISAWIHNVLYSIPITMQQQKFMDTAVVACANCSLINILDFRTWKIPILLVAHVHYCVAHCHLIRSYVSSLHLNVGDVNVWNFLKWFEFCTIRFGVHWSNKIGANMW